MAAKFKTLLQNLALLLTSILVVAAVAEIALRIILPAPTIWTYPQESYQFDPEIGHWLDPNQHAFTHDKPVSTNSVGIRDSEYLSVAPANAYRILAIGDSQTFGNGLDITDTWPKQLESLLRQTNNHTNTQILNCGLPGSDTWQHEIILKRLIQQYSPDAIVLAMYVNDIAKRYTPKPPNRKKGDSLQTRAIYILKQSSLLLTLRNAVDIIRHSTKRNKNSENQEELIISGQNMVLNEGWNQVEKSLSSMKQTTDRYNIFFMVVSLPRRDQVDGRLSGETYNSNLLEITERHAIPMINILDSLRMSYEEYGTKLFIPWDGHNSKIANQVIAQEITSSLQDATQGKH